MMKYDQVDTLDYSLPIPNIERLFVKMVVAQEMRASASKKGSFPPAPIRVLKHRVAHCSEEAESFPEK